MKIYISEPDEIDPNILKKFLSDYEIIMGNFDFDLNVDKEVEAIIIRSKSKVDNKIKQIFPNLKHVIRVGVGLDNVDLDYCKNNSINVYNAAGSNSNAVAEYVLATSLFALRNLHKVDITSIKNWDRFRFLGREVKSVKLGLIGFGNIARLVYSKFKALGCEDFLVYDPFAKSDFAERHVVFTDDISNVFKESDVISVHVPLTKDTKSLINEAHLNLLKSYAILVNSARGGIVNEIDLIKISKEKNFTYIADVFDNEPEINEELFEVEDKFYSPHIAAMTFEANTMMAQVAIQNFLEKNSVV